ncbi:MAG: metal-sulfur cluster assembly factor [Leptothrix sp. (in: b-proteobacteria)]
MKAELPFDYAGDEAWCEPILAALRQVVDPEVALSIVDVGLIYSVRVEPDLVHVLMTMTSAACPVTDVIVADVETELDRVLPVEMAIQVELC